MNVFVGLVFLIVGVLAALTGILLAVREAIGPRRGLYAGRNLEGIAGVINAAAALFDAIKGVPLSALFLLLGLIFMVFGTWILAAQPIKAKPPAANSALWLSKNPSVPRVTTPPPGWNATITNCLMNLQGRMQRSSLTLMRPPVVKRQTTPKSGYVAIFRGFVSGAVGLWQRVLT